MAQTAFNPSFQCLLQQHNFSPPAACLVEAYHASHVSVEVRRYCSLCKDSAGICTEPATSKSPRASWARTQPTAGLCTHLTLPTPVQPFFGCSASLALSVASSSHPFHRLPLSVIAFPLHVRLTDLLASAFTSQSSRTRALIGIGLMVWAGAGLLITDPVAEKMGLSATKSDRQRLASEVGVNVLLVEKGAKGREKERDGA